MPSPKKPKAKLVNVELTPEAHRRLKIACAATGLNFSQAVEQAINAWIDELGIVIPRATSQEPKLVPTKTVLA